MIFLLLLNITLLMLQITRCNDDDDEDVIAVNYVNHEGVAAAVGDDDNDGEDKYAHVSILTYFL